MYCLFRLERTMLALVPLSAPFGFLPLPAPADFLPSATRLVFDSESRYCLSSMKRETVTISELQDAKVQTAFWRSDVPSPGARLPKCFSCMVPMLPPLSGVSWSQSSTKPGFQPLLSIGGVVAGLIVAPSASTANAAALPGC